MAAWNSWELMQADRAAASVAFQSHRAKIDEEQTVNLQEGTQGHLGIDAPKSLESVESLGLVQESLRWCPSKEPEEERRFGEEFHEPHHPHFHEDHRHFQELQTFLSFFLSGKDEPICLA